MNPGLQKAVDDAVHALRTELGDNLHSCCLYGSAVRGNAIEGVSDINLLVILNESTSGAHEAVARAIGGREKIDPFVLGRRGLARSFRAFAAKFASIGRHYRVLCGEDPFAGMSVEPGQEKFVCEQALRNLRLRLVFSYVTRGRHRSYDTFVMRNVTQLFLRISEVLRLNGAPLPDDFSARIPALEQEFKIDGGLLRELLALKAAPRRLSEQEITELHARLFPVLDAVLGWVESHWQN